MIHNHSLPPQSIEALTEHIQREFPTMTPQFQVGAKYLLDFSTEVPMASMRKIAAQAGVQPATLVRLAQALGYAGWDGLKQVFVQSLRQATLHQEPRPYAEQARRLVKGKSPRSALTHTVAAQAANIRALESTNTASMPQAVQLLARAPRVHVAGFRASFAAASTFHYLYRLFRPSVTLIRGDAGTLEMELRAIGKSDTVIVISFAPYSQEALRVAQAARETGGRVVAICDSIVAPIALDADCVLVFATETPSFFPSSVAAIALVEILLEQLLTKAGKQAVAGLERTEDQLHRTGAYLNTKG